ncbi:MAG: response regulator [Candidatus Omnitrophota bacterium]
MIKKRVLLVDDEPDFVEFIKLRLEEGSNYEVKGLLDAKDIIFHVHTFNPDVILLDLLMPGIGGLEACEILNKDPLGITIPIIILTALDKEVDKVKAYKLGVVDYLVKPVESSILLEVVERAIKAKTQRT